MDPLSAVGLAGTIVQFVTFACSLLSKSLEIHNSVTGKSTDLTDILTVHEHLQSFSAKLNSQESIAPANGTDDAQDISALKDILQTSKTDCDQILKLVDKLDVKNGSCRRWKSFRAALELVWKRNEIEELDKRLQRTQLALTLHMSAMASRFHKTYLTDFKELRDTCERYQIKHEVKIENIFRILQTMESRYFPPKPGPSRDKITPGNISLVQPQDIEDLGQQMAELSFTVKNLSRQQSVLKSLNFEHRLLRHDRIPTAYDRTFGWVYCPERLETQCQLLRWLRTGSGIFWVSGKPGSGKSTFMKYLADDGRTQRVLDGWAHPQRVLAASHYFWNAGTAMQKSQQGLLQEILLKIFRQQPELIESIASERFLDPRSTNQPQPAWSTIELRLVLRRIAESELDVKVCLFIDGLDEYSGDYYW